MHMKLDSTTSKIQAQNVVQEASPIPPTQSGEFMSVTKAYHWTFGAIF